MTKKFQNNAVIFAESSLSGFRLAFVIGYFGTRHLPIFGYTLESPQSRVQSPELEEPTVPETSPDISLREFQLLIREMYFEKDVERGIDGTFMWLIEEVGELAASLREESSDEQAAEFADVLAWLATIANVAGIDLTTAVREKYGSGCPGCGRLVCTCDKTEKP